MEQLGKRHKTIPITWEYNVFTLASFTVALVGKNIEKCDMQFLTETFSTTSLMKQQSRDCIQFWMRGNHQSSLKHLEFNTHKIIIILWVESLQDMPHFTIINWFNRSGVWIWNIFRVKFNWKLWRVSLNITIINGMMIKSLRDSWKHRTCFGSRGYVFEVIFWRLAVPLYWWLSWFLTMKGVEFINLSSKTWWEKFRATDDTDISLVSNHPWP